MSRRMSLGFVQPLTRKMELPQCQTPVVVEAPPRSHRIAHNIPLYWMFLYFSLYQLTIAQGTPPEMRWLFISDLLNSSKDNAGLWFVRWSGWGLYAASFVWLVRWWKGRDVRWVFVWVAGFLTCMITGIRLEVFGGSSPDWLSWAHYVGSGVAFFSVAYVLWKLLWRAASFLWIVGAVVYIVLFLVDNFGVTPIDHVVFKVWENVSFWLFHIAISWYAIV